MKILDTNDDINYVIMSGKPSLIRFSQILVIDALSESDLEHVLT